MNPLTLPHLCYTLDTDEHAAALAYRERYGVPPEEIIEAAGLLWLGPVPTEQPEGCRDATLQD